MKRLKIWTAANAAAIKPVIGLGLKQLEVVPQNEFVAFVEGAPVPVPQKDEVVLICGAKCLDAAQKAGLIQKNRKVASLRETVIQPENVDGVYFVTYDPNVCNSEPDKLDIIHWDLQLVARWMFTGSLKPELGDYRWVSNFQDLVDRIEARLDAGEPYVDVAFDTETMGLVAELEDKDIVALGFTDRPGFAECMYFGPRYDPCPIDPDYDHIACFEYLFTNPKIRLRCANGKYDAKWVWLKLKMRITNFKFDTMLAGTLVNENRSNSLNLHAKTMTSIGGYDDELNNKYDKGHMELIPPDELLDYLGGDIDATYRSADVLREQLLEDEDLANFYVRILHPAARAFERIEERGVLVDVQRYNVLRDDLKVKIAELEKEALEVLPNKLKFKHKDKIEEQLAEGKSPFTAAILTDFFFGPQGLNLKPKMLTGKTQKPSTAKAHLRMFIDNPDAAVMIKALEEGGSASKTLSTFVDGFLKHLRPDGRFHPSYMLFRGQYGDDDGEDDASGTVTGRTSCKDPAFQTLPKKTAWAKRLRECYIAPKGKVMVQLDFSQGELRVVACVADEKQMIMAYEKKLDLHAVTGAKLGGVELEEFLSWKDHDDKTLAEKFDDLRGKAKPANFGLLYGMGWEGFKAYCWAQYGLILTDFEAQQMRDAFFELYPGLLNYHDAMRNFAHLHKHVRSPLGRVRHLPTVDAWDKQVKSTAERQAINSPIQATLTDMMLWAIHLIDAEFGDDVEIVGMIHDAMIAYIDEDKVQTLLPQVQAIMENLPFDQVGWKPVLRFPADAEYGADLAHLKKFKLAA